jgi:hypothetical protein
MKTYSLSSNRAQNTIRAMRNNIADPDLVEALSGSPFHAIDKAEGAAKAYASTTWEPSPQKWAKLKFREAVGCRLIGDSWRAQAAIEAAMAFMPGDAGLESERDLIVRSTRRAMG